MILLSLLRFVLIGIVTFFIVYFSLRIYLSEQEEKEDTSDNWKDF